MKTTAHRASCFACLRDTLSRVTSFLPFKMDTRKKSISRLMVWCPPYPTKPSQNSTVLLLLTGSTDLHQLNSQFSKEGRKDLLPEVPGTNLPASWRARACSLCIHLGSALGDSRLSTISHRRKLSSYLLYHLSLFWSAGRK